VLPIADRHNAYAAQSLETLRAAGVRAELDERPESIGRKIRDAELRKVPYMLVVGDREAETGSVSVREHGVEEAASEPIADLAGRIAEQTAARSR
jgi:threonyl-tRNA synthetase